MMHLQCTITVLYVTNLGGDNSVIKLSASLLHETSFSPQLQRRDGHDAFAMQSGWSVLPLSGTSSFWKGVEAYISQEAWIP